MQSPVKVLSVSTEIIKIKGKESLPFEKWISMRDEFYVRVHIVIEMDFNDILAT